MIEFCHLCGEVLNNTNVYSNIGMSMKCCSITCLAHSVLNIRVTDLETTKISMGELEIKDDIKTISADDMCKCGHSRECHTFYGCTANEYTCKHRCNKFALEEKSE